MWGCNATCDSTLLIVTDCKNIQEDMHRGENLRGGNSQRINYVLHERADMQMEGSEDAIRTE